MSFTLRTIYRLKGKWLNKKCVAFLDIFMQGITKLRITEQV